MLKDWKYPSYFLYMLGFYELETDKIKFYGLIRVTNFSLMYLFILFLFNSIESVPRKQRTFLKRAQVHSHFVFSSRVCAKRTFISLKELTSIKRPINSFIKASFNKFRSTDC